MAEGNAEVLIFDTGMRGQALAQAMYASGDVGRAVVATDIEQGEAQFTGYGPKPLVILGNEAYAIKGATNYFREKGYPVLGPTQQMAEYERSKAYFYKMLRGVDPSLFPNTVIAEGPGKLAVAQAWVEGMDSAAYIIKADGPSKGKGAVEPRSQAHAWEIVQAIDRGEYEESKQNEAINLQLKKSIKEPETSDIFVVDRHGNFFILPVVQDYKRIGNRDTGLMTGGVGAYGPVKSSFLPEGYYDWLPELNERVLWGMEKNGVAFGQAVLFLGLMGKQILEANVRFGDPESNVQLAIISHLGGNAYRLCMSAAVDELEVPDIDISNLPVSAATVVLSAEGYPGEPITGDEVYNLDKEFPGVTWQHAAIDKDGKTAGGRITAGTNVAGTTTEAVEGVYDAIDMERKGPESGKVGFRGMQVRSDIGWQDRN